MENVEEKRNLEVAELAELHLTLGFAFLFWNNVFWILIGVGLVLMVIGASIHAHHHHRRRRECEEDPYLTTLLEGELKGELKGLTKKDIWRFIHFLFAVTVLRKYES